MAQEAGSAAWVPVATAENTYASFYDVKPQMNTAYKVVYSGFTDPDQGTYGDNYTPSESAPFTIGVARKITRPSSGFVIKGKVTPDYAKKKIVIQVSKKEKKGYKSSRRSRPTRRASTRSGCPAAAAPGTGRSRSRVTPSTWPTASAGAPGSPDPRTSTHLTHGPAEHPLRRAVARAGPTFDPLPSARRTHRFGCHGSHLGTRPLHPAHPPDPHPRLSRRRLLAGAAGGVAVVAAGQPAWAADATRPGAVRGPALAVSATTRSCARIRPARALRRPAGALRAASDRASAAPPRRGRPPSTRSPPSAAPAAATYGSSPSRRRQVPRRHR